MTNPDDRRSSPTFPTTSGVAAGLIGTTEPKLSEIVRRGRVVPTPPILAGRRLWSQSHLRQAAEALGLLTEALSKQLGGGSTDA
jgi:hypothetical protein